jgi:hypothetical protein
MLSYRVTAKGKRERENRSMRPIISNDIGQVGNKTDSGTVCVLFIFVYLTSLSLCIFVCLPFSSFRFVLYPNVHFRSAKDMYTSSQEDVEQTDLNMTSTSDDHQQWTSTFDRLFYSYQRYNELRRKDDAIK